MRADASLELDLEDVTLAIDALAKAAARHEAEAHYVQCGRKHDEKAAAMRKLRVKLMRYRRACETADLAGATACRAG